MEPSAFLDSSKHSEVISIVKMEDVTVSTETDLEFIRNKYEEALSKDPASIVFAPLAEILRKQGEVDRAIEVLIKGLRHNPDNITARFILGQIYYERWMIDQAKKELKTVLDSSPDNIVAAKILLQIYISERDSGRALAIYHSSSVFHPEDDELKMYLRRLSNEINLIDQQVKDSAYPNFEDEVTPEGESMVKLDVTLENEEICTETMANLYIDQGSYENAIRILEKLLDTDPANLKYRNKLEQSKSYLLSEMAGFDVKTKGTDYNLGKENTDTNEAEELS